MIPNSFPNSRWFTQVLRDYKENSGPDIALICDCSDKFKQKWNDYFFDSKIKEYARKWIELHGYSFVVGNSIIFSECGNIDRRKIRIDFLSWLIKELKKEELPSARWFGKVYKDFKASNYKEFICHASPEFKAKWNVVGSDPSFRDKLRKLAEIWIKENNKQLTVRFDGYSVLFYGNSEIEILYESERRNASLDFLPWLIKRLRNEEKS